MRAGYFDIAALRADLLGAPEGSWADPTVRRTIALPMPDGTALLFDFAGVPVFHPELQARYPEIRTFTGRAQGDPRIRIKFDVTPHGFHAMIQGLAGDDVFIDPVFQGNDRAHQVYRKGDLVRTSIPNGAYCTYDQVNDIAAAEARTRDLIAGMDAGRAGDCTLRTYRLALACTGEYAAFHGGTVSGALAAMATTMNRVNGVYEKDMTLTMVMVANNDDLVFLNSVTDGYSNNDGGAMLGQNITKCNAVIGSSGYDIGHVFSTGGGGVAYLQSVCTVDKAGGVTGSSAPVGDPFDIDYVAHEMGHQFGGNHTQNNNCNRASIAAREVGSGITIMGYAGICAPDVASNSIAMFGGYSLQEMHAFVAQASHTCPVETDIVNAAPTANAGADRTIPKGTPFILTGTATDADGSDPLTYSWEQMDNAVATQPPTATNTGGPAFRPFMPVNTPVRYMPMLPAVIGNTMPTWEVLSNVGRTYNFRFTVRDNAPGGGCNAQDNMVVTVNGTAGPFLVTVPNTAVSWAALSAQTVTWDVAGTTASPVSCANVDILLSVDGGNTYPYTLLSATPNDGSQSVTLPNVSTTTARIMVRANANIFYDISNQDFSITGAAVVRLGAKVFLDGPYEVATGRMADGLRTLGPVPTTEPYTALGFSQAAGGGGETVAPAVLAVTGDNAVVDWIRLELRSATTPTTVLATRQALLQRDGDIVDVDGTSAVSFGVGGGNYHVAVRHRNHLGCMTSAAMSLSGTITTLDFTASAMATFGTDARKTQGAVRLLWAGNALRDGILRYTGSANDRDPILLRIGGVVPTNEVVGYYVEDSNLDGRVRYTGTGNDRDPILLNIGGVVPTNTRAEQLP
ncbi:MAG TPA: zinc-dependent metalloprotease family protein [Flavobacteriales bacterium]